MKKWEEIILCHDIMPRPQIAYGMFCRGGWWVLINPHKHHQPPLKYKYALWSERRDKCRKQKDDSSGGLCFSKMSKLVRRIVETSGWLVDFLSTFNDLLKLFFLKSAIQTGPNRNPKPIKHRYKIDLQSY